MPPKARIDAPSALHHIGAIGEYFGKAWWKNRPSQSAKDLLARIIENLKNRPGISPHDVMVLFIETARENWAFASGVQTYVDN